ncbi:hypothetical protein NKH18_20150 [Streptomyces sp. M10(2022)]
MVWDDAEAELHGTVQVRTRSTETGKWTGWQDLETHNAEHAADLGSAEGKGAKVHGSTAPLWVGDSNGVEVRVHPEADGPQGRADAAAPLPEGLRAELVDPGDEPQQPPTQAPPQPPPSQRPRPPLRPRPPPRTHRPPRPHRRPRSTPGPPLPSRARSPTPQPWPLRPPPPAPRSTPTWPRWAPWRSPP